MKGFFTLPKSSRMAGASPSDRLMSYLGHSLEWGGILPLCRDAVGALYSSSRLGWNKKGRGKRKRRKKRRKMKDKYKEARKKK